MFLEHLLCARPLCVDSLPTRLWCVGTSYLHHYLQMRKWNLDRKQPAQR